MRGILALAGLLVALWTGAFASDAASPLLPLTVPAEWTAFFPESLDQAAVQAVTEIPAVLGGAPGRKVAFTGDTCVLDRALTKEGPAVLMYEFDAAEGGLMQAGAGGDWFWSVQINGQTVLDLTTRGNGKNPISSLNHVLYLPVKKGRNLVVATVLRGSNGWKFAYGPVPFLTQANGVLREAELAASDCVLQYADGRTLSQSQGLQNAVFEGKGKNFTLTGDFAGGVKFVMQAKETQTAKGDYAIDLNYTLKSAQALPLKAASVVFRIPATAARSGSVFCPAGEIACSALPADLKTLLNLSLVTDRHKLGFLSAAPLFAVRSAADGSCEIAAEFPGIAGQQSASVSFQIIPGLPPYKITAGADWVPLPFAREVEKGSILDFSFLTEGQAPAGKFGRIVADAAGHFSYEASGKQVRLNGANLCFEANYLPKEECEALAEVFRKQGYNAVRFHHTDIHMIRGVWNAQTSYEIAPEMLDKLDYLFAAMKKAGIYVAIDFYTMRYFGPGEIEGVKGRISGDIKALLPVSDSAFHAWSKLVLAWMKHVNPYTGLAWKDDPALVFACPLNEDAAFSVLNDNTLAMQLYVEGYKVWKAKNNVAGDDIAPLKKDPRFTQYVVETKRASNRKIAEFLRQNGIQLPLTGSNWWNTMAQTFTRAEFDLVDNHQYADHPSNGGYNQSSALKGDFARTLPLFMAPTRVFGKPFTVTEFNFCFPNIYRAEGGALFGAYSALQDWDGIYRFAWSHERIKNLAVHPISHFDIASDPISLCTERQIALLFARGDVAPAKGRYVYAVSMPEAIKEGFGGMWTGGLFPKPFSALAAVSQVGSAPVLPDKALTGKFSGVSAEAAPEERFLAGNPYLAPTALTPLTAPDAQGEIVSDTGEVRLNPAAGSIRILTARTEALVTPPCAAFAGNCLSAGNVSSFTSLSASAMDGQPLTASRRILLFHLTNVLNSDMLFSSAELRRIESTGKLPHLVRAGSAEVSLKNGNADLRVYAVSCTGKRLRPVAAEYRDGAYRFMAEISSRDAEPVMAYELAE